MLFPASIVPIRGGGETNGIAYNLQEQAVVCWRIMKWNNNLIFQTPGITLQASTHINNCIVYI
jgi:hypothetical protein